MLRTVSLYCYTLPAASTDPPTVVNYTGLARNLSFTTVAPGGYGTFDCKIFVANPRLPRPELAMFSRVAVLDGPPTTGLVPNAAGTNLAPTGTVLFLGEITDSSIEGDSTGEWVHLQGLGLGNGMRDDPYNKGYTTQTVKQIAVDQFTVNNRANFLTIDQDTSQVFPNNPSGTYSPSYVRKNMEEVIGDVVTLAGDYHWGVWAHPTHTDGAGFPTGQLYILQRDSTTLHYQASLARGDVQKYSIQTSAERAYNVVAEDYYDPIAGTVSTATATDSRLGAGGVQGSAPFRRRLLARDNSGIQTVNSTQATAIAGTLLTLYKNPTNKSQVTLVAARDANGAPLSLPRVQANHNILIPEFAPRGTPLPTTPTPGVNVFYIVQSNYTESDTGFTLVLDLDNFFDSTSIATARLQLASDYAQRANKTAGAVQATGASEYGECGAGPFVATASAQTFGCVVNFKSTMTNTPTSITLTTLGSNLANTPTVSNITSVGFRLSWTTTGAGSTYWYGTYNTVGN